MIYEYVVTCAYGAGQCDPEIKTFSYWDEADEWIEQRAIALAVESIDAMQPAYKGRETLSPDWSDAFEDALACFTMRERVSRTMRD